MTQRINEIVRDTWDSLLGRVLILSVAAGAVPFWVLSKAYAALTAA